MVLDGAQDATIGISHCDPASRGTTETGPLITGLTSTLAGILPIIVVSQPLWWCGTAHQHQAR
jgi:hypothetical protein